jgi:hypothetical protein
VSSLKTNLFISAGGGILSFILLFGGAWLSTQIILHNHYFGTNNKEQFISFLLIQALILLPSVAMAVGLFVGYYVQNEAWWLVGASLLPLLIYNLMKGEWNGGEIILSLIYLMLGLISAFGVSRLQRRRVQSQGHV